MKRKLHLGGIILFIFLCFNACTKEEVGEGPQQIREIGKLSFGSLLSDLANREQLQKLSSDNFEIPECSSNTPYYALISLKVKNENGEWEWYNNSGEEKIQIEVNPQGYDLDGDDVMDAWFTQESEDLELVAGSYRLEYFAVNDEENNTIYMAPREPFNGINENTNIQYHNYVNEALPLDINIRAGVKYYQPVEVLCYEEHLAFAFGYLFFDFTNTDLLYLCTFGNKCQNGLQHLPARFKMNVWAGNSDQGELLVSAQNERESFEDENGTHYYANALCFPLPEIEEYYAEILLVDDDEEVLIREGSFDAEELQHIYREEQEHYYYHFRESCCEDEDNYNLLEDLTQNDGECQEEPQDPPEDCVVCDTNDDGKISKLKFRYIGEENIHLTVKNTISGSEIFLINNQEFEPGETITVQGEWDHSDHGYILGNNLDFFVEGKAEEYIHTSCSEELFLGKKTSLKDSENEDTQFGNFEIIYIKTSEGEQCSESI